MRSSRRGGRNLDLSSILHLRRCNHLLQGSDALRHCVEVVLEHQPGPRVHPSTFLGPLRMHKASPSHFRHKVTKGLASPRLPIPPGSEGHRSPRHKADLCTYASRLGVDRAFAPVLRIPHGCWEAYPSDIPRFPPPSSSCTIYSKPQRTHPATYRKGCPS